MFTTIMGIPAHPLLIHAAVVFIPLLIVGAIVYAAWPPFHGRITWAVLALAIIAPFSALFAKISGQNLRQQFIDQKISAAILAKIDVHNAYGNKTFWFTLALGVVTLLLLAYYWRVVKSEPPSMAVRAVGTVVMLVLGVFTGYYVYKTGDTGAHIVWQGV